ncbi:MAG: SPOR domain-containing protein [Bacteroidales bacterium]|nr:SPOR domain-containing protein [Bacteroidales bacterium]
MLIRKDIRLLFLLMFLAFSGIAGNVSNDISGNDTVIVGISQDETILFNMINDMRRQNKLASIPLSHDLCKVAQIHIADLIKWKPQEKGCSLHSWSGSGKWTSCCNTKEVFGIQCMKSKPREITGYQGDGYELIYWGEDNATPAEAAALWKEVGASSDMILSKGKWSAYQWKAIGVGIESGYAVLWLGDAKDKNEQDNTTEKVPAVQQPIAKVEKTEKANTTEKDNARTKPYVKQKEVKGDEKVVQPVAGEAATMYFLIVSSVKTSVGAEAELKKVKLKGYPDAIIIKGESVYRISIASYNSVQKAANKKNQLKDTFPGIWVFKK